MLSIMYILVQLYVSVVYTLCKVFTNMYYAIKNMECDTLSFLCFACILMIKFE